MPIEQATRVPHPWTMVSTLYSEEFSGFQVRWFHNLNDLSIPWTQSVLLDLGVQTRS